MNEGWKQSQEDELNTRREHITSPDQVIGDVAALLDYYTNTLDPLDDHSPKTEETLLTSFKNFVHSKVEASRYDMWNYNKAIEERFNEAGSVMTYLDKVGK